MDHHSPWRTNRDITPRFPVTVHWDRQTDVTDRLIVTPSAIWLNRLVFHCCSSLSREFLGILGCSLLSSSTSLRIVIIFVSFRFCLPPSCPLIRAASVVLFRAVAHLILPSFSIVLSVDFFFSTLSKTKEKQLSANARSLPVTKIVCIVRCFPLSCTTLLCVIATISILLFWVNIRLLFPAVFGLKSCPVSFRFSVRSLCYCRPFLLSSIHDFLHFNPEQNKRKSMKRARPVTASYCLANIFFCFQVRSGDLHSVLGQQDGVSQETSERYFFFLGLSPPLFRF